MNDEPKKLKNVFTLRNFRLVFFGALVSELGAVLYSFAVSFYILEISGNNAFLQGLYLAVCGIVLLVLTPVGGVLGDRYNKARIMFICDYVKGGLIVAATILMLILQTSTAHIAILFVIGIVGSAVSGIFSPASGALLPHIVEEEQLQQANSYYTLKSSLQGILGIVLAGIMYAVLPIYTLFFIVGTCYIISGFSEMFIRYRSDAPGEKLTLRLVLMDMRDGVVYLKGQKAITALMIAILFINFFLAPLGNFLPYFIKTDVALSPSYLFDSFMKPEMWSSVFEMMIGISSIIGSVILSTRTPDEKCGHKTAVRICAMAVVMIFISVCYGILVANGVSLNAFLICFSIGCFLTGLLTACINIPISTALMRRVEKDKLSKVTSIISIASQGLSPIASVLAGMVLQFFGSLPLLIVCSVGFTVAAVLLLFNKEAKNI